MRQSRVFVGVSAAVLSLAVLGPLASATAQQPPPSSPDIEGFNPNIVYRDSYGDIHVVRVQNQADSTARTDVGDYDISNPAWPSATGTPGGYSSAIDPMHPEEHVVYRSPTGHVIELWKHDSDVAWHKTDLTLAAATKARAAGSPLGWSHDARGRQWVVYRAVNGQIHGLTWTSVTNHWKDVNLSLSAHTKALAAADPTQYVDSVSKTPRPLIVYRAKDKHVHLLVWLVSASSVSWHDLDLSALAHYTGVPVGRPYGFASAVTATSRSELHALFRTANGHVQELYGGFGFAWKHNDLTVAAKTKVTAVSDVQGTVGTNEFIQDYEAVQYKGSDGKLHQLYFSTSPATPWTDSTLDPVGRVGLWFQDGTNSYTTYLVGTHLWVSERQWVAEDTDASDLTTLFSATTHPATGTGGYFTPGAPG